MRISIIIPTTDGPTQILRLAPLLNAPRSVMRTQDDYRPLPVSAAYQSFTAQGGPLNATFGIDASAFDLRLTDRIDTGRSWELPVALAHWLMAEGHHLGVDTPELVIWATGALDLDMDVISQDYHLETKISASLSLLRSEVQSGCRVVMLLPGSESLPADLEKGVVVHYVNSAQEAVDCLRPLTQTSGSNASAPAFIPAQRSPLWNNHILLGGMGLAALTAIALLGASSWRPETTRSEPANITPIAVIETARATVKTDEQASSHPENGHADELPPRTADATNAAATVLPMLILLRPKDTASCFDVLFGDADPVREIHAAEIGRFNDANLAPLCAVGLQIPEEATGHWTVQLPETLLALVIRSDRLTEFTLVPGEERLFRLTANLPKELELRWHLSDTLGEAFEFSNSLSVLE